MKTIKQLKSLFTWLLIVLAGAHLILSFFFYKEVMFRTNLPVTLDFAIIITLLILGYIKYRSGDALPRKVSVTSFLTMTVVALLTFILITRNAHKRQVEALTNLIIKLNK